MEKQILENKQNEEKLKKENFLYKRQSIQYKDHLNFELASRNKYVFNAERRPDKKLSIKDTKDKSLYTTSNDIVSRKNFFESKIKNLSGNIIDNYYSKDSPLNVTSQFNDSTILDVQAKKKESKDVSELTNTPKACSNYAQRRLQYVAKRNSSLNKCKNDSPDVRTDSQANKRGSQRSQLVFDADAKPARDKSQKFEDKRKLKNSQLKDLVRRNLDEELLHLEKEEIFLSSLKNDLCIGEMDKLLGVKENFDLLSYVGYHD